MKLRNRAWKALLPGGPWNRAWKALLLGGLAVLGGCTWVKLSDAGALVQQVDDGGVAGCKRVGIITAQTRNKVVVGRKGAKVREELLVLARNEAATLGGDTIIPIGPAAEGRQEFTAYRCKPETP